MTDTSRKSGAHQFVDGVIVISAMGQSVAPRDYPEWIRLVDGEVLDHATRFLVALNKLRLEREQAKRDAALLK